MANSYLTRTPSSASNRKTFTMSAWLKLSSIGSARKLLYVNNSSTDRSFFGFESTDTFKIQNKISNSVTCHVETNRLFRDVSAWYHLVIAVDTTQATDSNRVKLYVNGVQETSLSTATYPSQNEDWQVNNTVSHGIGRRIDSSQDYFDGYMSHVALVDGTALTPTTFGETDSTSGIWKFKSPSGVTWGTNGFHLKFENSGNLGLDSSGNSNTFTVNGNGRQALDTPSNVYATLNPLGGLNGSGKGTFQNGNTTWISSSTDQDVCNSTISINDGGKYYCEMKCVSKTGGQFNPGIFSAIKGAYDSAYPSVFARGDGVIYNNGSQSQTSLASISNGDIIGMAYDGSGGTHTLQFYKNGSTYGSAENITNTPDYPLFFGDGTNSGSVVNEVNFNFGNGYFGTTAITSAGSNGNGSLFEYDVPSGYYALNTKNINTYG